VALHLDLLLALRLDLILNRGCFTAFLHFALAFGQLGQLVLLFVLLLFFLLLLLLLLLLRLALE
jgi:hypothetical protein